MTLSGADSDLNSERTVDLTGRVGARLRKHSMNTAVPYRRLYLRWIPTILLFLQKQIRYNGMNA